MGKDTNFLTEYVGLIEAAFKADGIVKQRAMIDSATEALTEHLRYKTLDLTQLQRVESRFASFHHLSLTLHTMIVFSISNPSHLAVVARVCSGILNGALLAVTTVMGEDKTSLEPILDILKEYDAKL